MKLNFSFPQVSLPAIPKPTPAFVLRVWGWLLIPLTIAVLGISALTFSRTIDSSASQEAVTNQTKVFEAKIISASTILDRRKEAYAASSTDSGVVNPFQ